MSHWCDYAALWNRVSPPLRPTQLVVETIARLANCGDGAVLQLGVTPELAAQFPRLDMVDRSQAMIDRLWPGDQPLKRAIAGDWFDTPTGKQSYAAIVGDGSLNVLGSATDLQRLFMRIDALLRPGGRFVCRVFTRPTPAISVEVLKDIAAGRAPMGFAAFKWMLAMQRAEANGMAIPVTKILARFNALFPNRDELSLKTGWAREDINTIDVYSESRDIYIFPTREELSNLAPVEWSCQFVECSGYEISELCPIFVIDKPI